MKRLSVLSTVLLIALSALPTLAANLTGKWAAEDKDPNGNPSTITYDFKQDGVQLTGTVAISAESTNISSGKVEGDQISFSAAFSFGTIAHTGTVHGDEITMTVKSDNADFAVHEITPKRSK
jgi:hypothetical protein